MEEIETSHIDLLATNPAVSVGAPTWRGLKPLSSLRTDKLARVSRCPDMEGIETVKKSTSLTLWLYQ